MLSPGTAYAGLMKVSPFHTFVGNSSRFDTPVIDRFTWISGCYFIWQNTGDLSSNLCSSTSIFAIFSWWKLTCFLLSSLLFAPFSYSPADEWWLSRTQLNPPKFILQMFDFWTTLAGSSVLVVKWNKHLWRFFQGFIGSSHLSWSHKPRCSKDCIFLVRAAILMFHFNLQ